MSPLEFAGNGAGEGAEAETAGAARAPLVFVAAAAEPSRNLRRPGESIGDLSPFSLAMVAPLTGAADDAAEDASNGGAVGSGMRDIEYIRRRSRRHSNTEERYSSRQVIRTPKNKECYVCAV